MTCRRWLVFLSLAGFLLLGGCTGFQAPLTETDMQVQALEDLDRVFAEQEPLTRPISLYEAMARAIRFNLDNRLRVMEEALANRQVDVAGLSLLPDVTVEGELTGRSNQSASRSEAVEGGQETLQFSTSQERVRKLGNLTAAWNVLDFGVSYFGARQQTNRALIAEERRRKVIHNIIQDVRRAYWRAVAAQRLIGRLDPLIAEVDAARRDAIRIEELRLRSPLEALTYQRTLLETLRQLKALRRDLVLSHTQLAALMNLPPSTRFDVAVPDDVMQAPPEIALTPVQIEEVALLSRPELREEAYQKRIGVDETRRAMLRLLPGVEANWGYNYDSNKFLFFDTWAEYSFRVTWNLFNILRGPVNVWAAEAAEDVNEARRLALSMAVLTQARVAVLRYQQALEEWQTTDELADVEGRILEQILSGVAAGSLGELDLILANADAVVADLRADLAYANLQNAAGQIFVTMGADPLPQQIPDATLETVANAIRNTEQRWYAGDATAWFPPVDDGATGTGSTGAEAPAGDGLRFRAGEPLAATRIRRQVGDAG